MMKWQGLMPLRNVPEIRVSYATRSELQADMRVRGVRKRPAPRRHLHGLRPRSDGLLYKPER